MTPREIMSQVQPQYDWLWDYIADGHPKIVVEALKLYGVREGAGPADNPEILGWAKEVGGAVEQAYTADSIPWCGLFAALVVQRAGKALPTDVHPLWALDWRKFGEPAPVPMFGDVAVFNRPGGGGHVGLIVGQDATSFHVLGGNTSDMVRVARLLKTRLVEARRPVYSVVPLQVKVVTLPPTGRLSTNEA